MARLPLTIDYEGIEWHCQSKICSGVGKYLDAGTMTKSLIVGENRGGDRKYSPVFGRSDRDAGRHVSIMVSWRKNEDRLSRYSRAMHWGEDPCQSTKMSETTMDHELVTCSLCKMRMSKQDA